MPPNVQELNVHIFNSTVVSGPEMLVLPALARWDRKTVIVFLVETRRTAESMKVVAFAESLGLETRTVPVRSRLDRGAAQRLRFVIEELRPAVVHAHDVKASTYLAAAAKKPRDFPIFSTHHGVRGRSGFKIKFYEAFYTRLILPKFDRVLAVCSSDYRLLLKRGLDEAHLKLHLNGVDRQFVSAESREEASRAIRSSWGLGEISEKTRILGVVGRIAPEKRLDRLIHLARHLIDRNPALEWTVLIFGAAGAKDKALEAELRGLASSLGVESHLRWMGYRAGIGNELAGLDLLLSFSPAEGLPINLIEAGWAGTPVFATAVDGNLDLIPSSAEGKLVPPTLPAEELARELHELLRDAGAMRSAGLKFQDRVKSHFSGSRWLRDLGQLYDSFLGRQSFDGTASRLKIR